MDSIISTILNGFKNLSTIITFLGTLIFVDTRFGYTPSVDLLLSHEGLRYTMRLIVTHLIFYGFFILILLFVMRLIAKKIFKNKITIHNYKEIQQHLKHQLQKKLGLENLDLNTRKKLSATTKSIFYFIPSLPILMLQGTLIYGGFAWLSCFVFSLIILQMLVITSLLIQTINKFDKIQKEQIVKKEDTDN